MSSNSLFLGLPLPLLGGVAGEHGGGGVKMIDDLSGEDGSGGLPLPLLGGVAGEHRGGSVKMTDDLSGEDGSGWVKTRVFESNIEDFGFCLLFCFCTDFHHSRLKLFNGLNVWLCWLEMFNNS